jgi:hypothetical protein
MPFKFHEAQRHRVPKARYRVQNWPDNAWRPAPLLLTLDGAEVEEGERNAIVCLLKVTPWLCWLCPGSYLNGCMRAFSLIAFGAIARLSFKVSVE